MIQLITGPAESEGHLPTSPLDFDRITLNSGIDVGQGINVGHGKFGKKNKRWASEF